MGFIADLIQAPDGFRSMDTAPEDGWIEVIHEGEIVTAFRSAHADPAERTWRSVYDYTRVLSPTAWRPRAGQEA